MSREAKAQLLIGQSAVAEHRHECPCCQSNTVAVEGYFKRNFVRQVANGKVSSEQMDEHYREGVSSIYCAQCEIVFHVQPDDIVEMQREMITMRILNGTAEGLFVVPEKTGGKPN